MKSDTKIRIVVYLTTTEASLLKQITTEQGKSESEIGRTLFVQFVEANL